MGQKVTPTGFRLGITYKPQSQWFVDPRSGSMKKIYPPLILEDKFIRDFITQKFPRAAIAQILIYRTLDYIKIEIHTAQAKKLSSMSSPTSTLRESSNNRHNSTTSVSSSQKVSDNSDHTSQENNTNGQESSKLKVHGAEGSQTEPNETIKSHSGSSNLKNLQQDLQIALLKYKKTLQVFSSWKHDSFYAKENLKYQKDETQELPKLWSYDSNPLNTQVEDNLERELRFFEEREKVTQPIGIIVKQLNQPFQYASVFAKYLVSQLERRENSVKQALNRSLRLIQNYNIQGIKIKVSGRLNGVDMAEQENILKGRIPLSTINANIDYFQDTAQTLYGTLGVKVFIYR